MRFSVRNLWEFAKDRPPIVVFFMCLVALIITNYFIMFFMQEEEKILDSDVKYDWLEMLKHFNSLDTCVEDSTKQGTKEINKNEQIVQTILTFDGKNIDVLKKYGYIWGYLSTEGWEKSCTKHISKPKDIEIYFDVPHNITEKTNKLEVCVTLKAPFEYLPLFSSPYCEVTSGKSTNENVGLISSTANYDSTFCSGGSKLKMNFEIDKNVQIVNYLDDDIKTKMYIRISWIGFVGLILLFVMILYALAYENNEKKDML